jgi:poly(A) polymerase
VLGGQEDAGSGAAAAAREVAIAHLADACVAALPGDLGRGALHLIGAVRLGVAEPGGDVDAVAVGPDTVPRRAFFEGTREWLAAVGGEVRIAGEAVAPVLRGAVAGVAVDLGYAALPADLAGSAPETLGLADLDRLDPESRGAILAVRDAAAVRAAVAERGAEGAFRLALRALKRWARGRGLYSNAFGFLSGFGWTLIAAWAVTREGDFDGAPAVLGRAFAALAAGGPLALNDEAAAFAPRARDVLVLPTPSAPSRNAARNVTRATAAVIRAEAARAARICERARRSDDEASWVALFEPWDARVEAGPWLDLTLRAEDGEALAASAGWVEGHVLGLLLDLEAGAAPLLRPDPRRVALPGEAVRYTVCLGPDALKNLAAASEAAARFEQAFGGWSGRPAGASLRVEIRTESRAP